MRAICLILILFCVYGCNKCEICVTTSVVTTEIITFTSQSIDTQTFSASEEFCGNANIKQQERRAGEIDETYIESGAEYRVKTVTSVSCN